MKRLFLIFICFNFGIHICAQETLTISREEAEAMFLQNNLLLVAEKLNIESQRAEVIQARLWPNPEFSVSEVNLWRTTGVEPSPPLIGNFGRDQQIAFELNQLIQTAGKRQKLIALEEIDVSKSEQYFEHFLRGLKLELRTLLTELQFVQNAINIHQDLIDNISKLTQAYENQVKSGNISRTQYVRLKAQALEMEKEILTLTQQSNEIQKELKMLLRTNPTISIEITTDGFVKDTQAYRAIFMEKIIDNASENRPDYKLAVLEQSYAEKMLAYEKAQRTPDLTLGVSYDRNGSTMLDFIGFGVSFDLPVFNRNKGNIKKAQISIKNAEVKKEQSLIAIENDIYLSYRSLQQAIDFLDKIDADYVGDLDLLLEKYTQNFVSRNVSMLEYFDFMDAYLSNKKIILEAQRDVNQKAEAFNYSIGKDL